MGENEANVEENLQSGNEDIEVSEQSVSSGDAGVENTENVESVENIENDTETEIQYVEYDTMYSAVYDATVDALAASQDVTDGQTVSSAAISYFNGILGNQKLPVDYVVYVGEPYTYYSGYNERIAYEYCMAYGDLELSGSHFTGNGTIVKLRMSGNVSVSTEESQAINLYAPMYYSRSNLGAYSGIYQYDYTGLMVLFGLILGGVIWFVRKLTRLKY